MLTYFQLILKWSILKQIVGWSDFEDIMVFESMADNEKDIS